MFNDSWFERIQKAQKIGIIQDGKRKIHYTFGEGLEMVEEYDVNTDVLVKRAWRNRTKLKGDGDQWDVEIGDNDATFVNLDVVGIKESVDAPVVTRRITKSSLEWRIRNLPYPVSIYSVTAEPDKKCITVRTSNKKYYKTLPVPDLERVGLLPEQGRIQFTHKFNTLIITYKKPPEVLDLDKKVLEEVKAVKTTKESDPQCKTS